MPASMYVVDTSLPSVDLVYGLINNDNNTVYSKSTLNLATPTTNTNPAIDRNSKILASNIKYSNNTLMLYYDRLDIADVLRMELPIILSNVTETTVDQMMWFFNSTYKMGLTKAEISASAVDLTGNTTTWTIEDSSMAWVGNLPLTILPTGYGLLVDETDNQLLDEDGSYLIL